MGEGDTMDRAKYQSEMSEVGKSSLGLEMVNHVAKCGDCRKVLEDAQKKVISHIQSSN